MLIIASLAMATVDGSKAPAIPANPLSAPNAEADSPPVPGSAAKAHHDPDQTIVVTGVRRRAEDVVGGVSVVDEAELNRSVKPSIGETLAKLPGVSATSFGPKASAPVLRGLQGDRIRILTDGIGTLDMSALGPDHEVAINPITAQSIEVLRGPAALLFGSSAIGGVVNVIDARIPRRVPTGTVGFDGMALYGSAASDRAVNGSLNVPVGDHIVIHADGNYEKTDDLRIGGYVLSKALREQALASGDPDIEALAQLKGTLPHSRSRTAEGAIGLAYIDGALNLGVSVTRHTSDYEVPIRYCFEPACDYEQPTLTPRETRFDARAEVPLGGIFSAVKARGGYAKYHHNELNGEGGVDSSFFSNGGEGRLELVQSERNGWGGTTGIQFLDRTARIEGDEVLLPPSEQRQKGLFTLQTFVAGPLRLEGGARVERSRLTAEANAQTETPDASARFTIYSASLAGQYEILPGWRAGLSLSHSERAPAVNELFANGPHGGEEVFERGNAHLSKESSNGAEVSLHHVSGPVHVTGNLYYSRFSNFIFQAPTGEVEDGLPVYEFRSGKSDYYGFELQSDARFGRLGGVEWGGELQADAVHATIRDFGPAPLIPPMRILGGVGGTRGQVDGRLEVEHAFEHMRTAPLETETPAYTLVNASLDWHPFAANPQLSFSLIANNIFDVEARRSTSLLKDYAPLAGRDIRLSARVAI
jgi:iron complex outermembrane receptor protein